MNPTLIIVCGLPGSGKTTHATLLEGHRHALRLSPDEWLNALSLDLYDEDKRAKIEALQWTFAQKLLALGLTVIIEWGTWGRSERDTLRIAAQALGANVELHYLSAPADVLFDRIQRRGMENPPIEQHQLARWTELFQVPTAEEFALFDKHLTLEPADSVKSNRSLYTWNRKVPTLVSSPVDLYVDKNETRFLDELLSFLRIPSISTLPERKPDVARAAQFVADALKTAGIENVEIIPTANHPLVYGDWLHAPGKPTVLCYGHYDVQPPDPLELWKSPPFEPEIRDGNIYARGSCDDKGQMYMHIKAVEALFRVSQGKLPLNVKFLIEGEEEIGGESIAKYVPLHKDKLKADVALVSDTEMFADGVPTLCIGLRGLMYLEVEARGASRDLHSGVFGGAAPNAVFGLIELLSKAKDADGRIQIPGIYDDVKTPDPAEVASWQHLPFSEKEFLETGVGATSLTGEPDQSVLARVWARPTFEVHGIAGGFTGAGAKTVIPATATAKVSFRLVPEQKYEKVLAQFREWVRAHTPKGIQTEVRMLSGGPAILVNPHHPAIQVAAKAFSDKLQKPTVLTRSGGSIPIVGDFARELGIPTVLMGFGLPDDGLHSPNEKYRVSNFYNGIRTIAYFLDEYAKTR